MPEHRPAWVEVHLGALLHNLSHLRQHTSGTSVMAVVKANAYGHGLLEVGRFYERSGVEWLAVALMEEGVALRRAGIQIPILVLGGIAPWQIRWGLEHQLDLTVGSIEVLQAVEAAAGALGKTAAVHLKLDTGMERVGIRAEESGPLIEAALRSASVEARGVYSHLACADDPEHPMTSWQIERFLQACQQWEHLGEPLPMRHLANSGGVLHFPESHLDCVRAGIMLYGILPDPQSRSPFPLQPALSLKAEVSFSKKIPSGASVSYGASWVAPEATHLATVPLGYGDGYRRGFSNQATILFREQAVPVRGRVCMDQFMIDTGSEKALLGETVTLIGAMGAERIRVEDLAQMSGTIPYEILTGLNERLPRIYLQDAL
jgi:alanine racemase